MIDYYFDRQVNEAIRDYLGVWDPVRAYYFHKYAAISVNVPDCDERLFSALRKMSQYLPSDEKTAREVGLEAEYCFKRLMELDEDKDSDENLHLMTVRSQGDAKSKKENLKKIFRELHKSYDKTGILSTLASWSGAIGKWLGNVEGPPTVMSILLYEFSKTDAFLNVLRKDTLVRAIVTIGLPRELVVGIARSIRDGLPIVHDLERLRNTYKKYSWRSPVVLHVFMLLGVATLMYDIGLIVDEVEQGKTDKDPTAEMVRLMTKLAHDTTNLGLTWITLKINRQMKAVLTENINARASDLYARVSGAVKVKYQFAVKSLHGSLAALDTVLKSWDLAERWDETDMWQKVILFVNVGSGLTGLVGAVFSIPLLGKIALITGLVVSAVLALYENFQPGIKKTLLEIIKGYEQGRLFSMLEDVMVKSERCFVVFEKDVAYSGMCNDLKSRISDYNWDKPVDPGDAVRYQRAGLSLEALLKLYEMDKSKMQQLLRAQRNQEKQRRESNLDFKVRVLKPGPDAKLILGAASHFEVEVINHTLVPFIWLDIPYENLKRYFSTEGSRVPGGSLNSFDPDKAAIVLKRQSYSKNVQIFSGMVFLKHRPAGENSVGFDLVVPKGNKKPIVWQGIKPPDAHYKEKLDLVIGIKTL